MFRIRADPAHTYAIQGVGTDEVASCIILLQRIGHFGHKGRLPDRLEVAFVRFREFCANSGKHTSITSFDLGTFKMKSTLNSIHVAHNCQFM